MVSVLLLCASLTADSRFVRGDVAELVAVNVADAVRILAHLFVLDSAPPLECHDAADVNDDGRIDITDPIYLLRHLFAGTAPPPAPFPGCRNDPTPDDLGCEVHWRCRDAGPAKFGGQPLDAGAVFFVIDRSQYMQGLGELNIAKRQVIHWLAEADFGTRLGVIFSDASVLRFPGSDTPAVMQDSRVFQDAIDFIQDATGGSGSCLREALLAALDWVDAVAPAPADIVLVSGGAVDCPPETPEEYQLRLLQDVTARNAGRARIHTVGELVRTPEGADLLEELAAQNGGWHLRVNR